VIKNPTKLAIIRNSALFLIKAAVIKKTCAIVYYALDQADRWRTATFVCFNTGFQKRLDLARRIPWQIQPVANACVRNYPNGCRFDFAGL
jgi:hypothetical protein